MITVFGVDVDNAVVIANLQRIVNQVYKLLPMNEEGKDWQKPLQTVQNELIGMFNCLPDLSTGLAVVSKLEGLKQQGKDVEFAFFRRTIFECCTLISKLEQSMMPE